MKRGTGSRLAKALRRKAKSMCSVSGALFWGLAILVFLSFFHHADGLFSYRTALTTDRELVQMESGRRYAETTTGLVDSIRGVNIRLGTNDRANEGTLHVTLSQDSKTLASWTLGTADLKDDTYQRFDAPRTLDIDPDKPVVLELWDEFEPETENNIGFYISRPGDGALSEDSGLSGSICKQWNLVNDPERSCYKPVYLALLAALILFAAGLLDFTSCRWWALALAGILILFGIQFVDYDLLDSLNTKLELQGYDNSSKSTAEIEPGAEASFDLSIQPLSFNRVEWFMADRSDGIQAEITRTATGEVVYNGPVNHWFDDTRGPGISAVIATEDRLSPGDYAIRILNQGDDPIRLFTLRDGGLNAIVEQRSFLAQRLIMVVGFILAFASLFIGLYAARKLELSRLYIAMAVPLALTYLVLFVPWSQPDTATHFLAAYRCSNILLNVDAHVGRQEDADFFFQMWDREANPSLMSYTAAAQRLQFKCTNPELVGMPTTPQMDYYSMVNYLPEAIGFALGHSLGLGTVVCIYLGRFLILLTYLAITWRAVSHTPVGKGIFATVALLPMSLMMSSAISYDPLAIAVPLAFYAGVLYLKKHPHSLTGLADALLWCVLLGAVKGGGYVCLLPVLFVLAKRDRRAWINIGCLALAAIGSVVLFDLVLPKGSLYQFGETGGGKLYAGYVLLHPIKYLNMSLEAFLKYTDHIFINTGGTYLGKLEFTMPSLVVMLLYILGTTWSIFEPDALDLSGRDQTYMALAVVVGTVGTPMMLLSWTEQASKAINGLQGRYFLPFVPALLLALTKFRLHHPLNGDEAVALRMRMWRAFWAVSMIAVFFMTRLYFTR